MKSLQLRFSIRTQLLALFGLLLLAGAIVLVLDEIALRRQIATFDSLQRDSLTGLRLAKSISDAYGLEIVDTTYRVRNYLMGWDQGVATVDTAEADIHHDWDALIKTNLSPDQRELIDEVAKARVIADQAATKLRGILKAQDMPALGKFADTELYPAIDPVTNRLQVLADVKMLDAERSVSGHLTRARGRLVAHSGEYCGAAFRARGGAQHFAQCIQRREATRAIRPARARPGLPRAGMERRRGRRTRPDPCRAHRHARRPARLRTGYQGKRGARAGGEPCQVLVPGLDEP
jgi:hypothetical protein